MKNMYTKTIGGIFALAAIAAATHLAVADLSVTSDTGAKINGSVVGSPLKISGEAADTNKIIATASDAHVKATETFAADVAVSTEDKKTDADFCEALDAAFMRQAPEVRAAYAWNATSYQSSLAKAGAAGLSAYGGNTGYLVIQNDIEALTPKSGELNGMQSMRAKAILRSSMLGMLLHANANSEISTRMKSLRDGAARCVAYFSNDAKTQDVLAKTNAYLAPEGANKNVPQSYIDAVVAAHTNVKSVSSDEETVVVKFKEKGKFLGFISMMITRAVTVNADGSAALSGGALSKKSGLYTDENLQAAVTAMRLPKETTLSIEAQQKIIVEIAKYTDPK